MSSRMPVGKLVVVVFVALVGLWASAPTFKMPWLFDWLMDRDQARAYARSEITYGLDLQGGMDLVYRVQTEDEDEVRTAAEIIRNRIDLYGVSNATVQPQAGNQVRVQVPGVDKDKQQKIKEIIDLTHLLTLHSVATETQNVMSLAGGPDQIILEQSLPRDKNGKPIGEPSWFLLDEEPLMSGEAIRKAFIGFDGMSGKPTIRFEIRSEYIDEFTRLSEEHIGRRIAVVLGKKVFIAPVMKGRIPGGKAEITGDFDIEEARRITSILKAGALPAELEKLSESTVGPTLGQESIQRGMSAARWGIFIVLVYMVVYYKLAGFFAVLALLLNLILLTAGLRFFDAALTLPGIAGVILTIGMAVDANVIIFERIREERNQGKSIRGAIAGGFDKALSAVLDSNITTLITAVVLYLLGSGPVKGFAVTLALGILCSLFTALFCVRTFLDATYAGKKLGTISI